MATNFINNLSNTYRGSPSLQNQFATEQDYLDLFDNNQITPAMAQAYISVDDTSGIKSIINKKIPIINQGDDGDNNNITVPTTGFSSQGAPYGNAKGGMHNYDDDDDGLGFKDALGLAFGGPFGYATGKIGQWAFNKTKEKINDYREKKAAEKKAANDKKKAEIAAIQTRIDKEYEDSGGGGFTPKNDPTGSKEKGFDRYGDGKAAMGGLMGYGGKSGTPKYKQYFKGGVVNLKNGGSTNGSGEKAFSAKVKELMDDGYEFGEAVKEAMKQGYMNGGRIKSYFKGGLVSLRGK